MQFDAAYFNAKYSAFYVIGWSKARSRCVAVGRPYPTVQAALRACKRLEAGKRHAGDFLTIDVVKPAA
jgi:hypothetical protein